VKRGLVAILSMTAIGLVVVYGELEAVRIGYQIRQLSIQKHELTHRLKKAECEIASMVVPRRLEERMSDYRVKLAKAQRRTIALAGDAGGFRREAAGGFGPSKLLARILLSEAKADTAR